MAQAQIHQPHHAVAAMTIRAASASSRGNSREAHLHLEDLAKPKALKTPGQSQANRPPPEHQQALCCLDADPRGLSEFIASPGPGREFRGAPPKSRLGRAIMILRVFQGAAVDFRFCQGLVVCALRLYILSTPSSYSFDRSHGFISPITRWMRFHHPGENSRWRLASCMPRPPWLVISRQLGLSDPALAGHTTGVQQVAAHGVAFQSGGGHWL